MLAMASSGTPQGMKALSPASRLLQVRVRNTEASAHHKTIVGAGLLAMASSDTPQGLKAYSPASRLLQVRVFTPSRWPMQAIKLT